MERVVIDMRELSPKSGTELYYGIPGGNRPSDIIHRPMEWLGPDLDVFARLIHPDIAVCWDRDVAEMCAPASGAQLFSGADEWRGQWTLLRAHMLGSHGYQVISVCFSANPVPHWWVAGRRDIQIWRTRNYLNGSGDLASDDNYVQGWDTYRFP